MGKESQTTIGECPDCGWKGVLVPAPDMFRSGDVSSACPRCNAMILIHRGDSRIEGRVEGTSSDEVSEVVKTIIGSNAAPIISVTNSTIGLLNAGEIEDIGTISVNVKDLHKHGIEDVALAIKKLTEAVAESELNPKNRSEALDQLQELSQQATAHPEKRAKTGVIRAIFNDLANMFIT